MFVDARAIIALLSDEPEADFNTSGNGVEVGAGWKAVAVAERRSTMNDTQRIAIITGGQRIEVARRNSHLKGFRLPSGTTQLDQQAA
ncbi:hypothetical protein [Rhizobium sp. LCM 4573]|uniref:hypothetical protein n=1 Tax=Rhizobium sp. LCM 4573 TaxID=1848291 RepID=UPI0018E2F666|nr:hypothetical protein [Rhizobium sp. LCM 4573]